MNADWKLRNQLKAHKTDYYERHGTHGILIPSFREIERDCGKTQGAVSGHFRIEARSARYKGPRVLADFKNLILDAGLARIASGNPVYGNIQLGSGTTTPAASQTSLANYTLTISSLQNATNSWVAGPPAYSQRVYQYRSSVGGATGTFSEVGIGWTSVGNLFSRALILDSGGSPTTITVLSDEVLDVYYTFRWYPYVTDTTGTITISGSSYNWVARPSDLGYAATAEGILTNGLLGSPYAGGSTIYDSTSTLGTVTGSPSGTYAYDATGVINTVAGDNNSRDWTLTWPLASTPSGGVGAAKYVMDRYQVREQQQSFSPAIPKTSSQTLSLTTRHTIARYP